MARNSRIGDRVPDHRSNAEGRVIMPRFFFDVHENGTLETDDAGAILADLDAARAMAIEAIKDTVTDEVIERDLADITTARIDIRDEAGAVVGVVTYAEALGTRH